MKTSPNRFLFLAGVLLFALLCGCKNQLAESAPAERMAGLKLAIDNFTDEALGTVFIDEQWAGNMPSHGSGNGGTCCVSLPQVWREGLTVKVSWQSDSMYLKDPRSLAERVIKVPPYETLTDGGISFMYFPGDQVRVFVGSRPGNRDFPFDLNDPVVERDQTKIQRFLDSTAWTVEQ